MPQRCAHKTRSRTEQQVRTVLVGGTNLVKLCQSFPGFERHALWPSKLLSIGLGRRQGLDHRGGKSQHYRS
eukprot:5659650-Amphidinium_carterae.1